MKLTWRLALQTAAMALILTAVWCGDYLVSTKAGNIAAIIIFITVGVLILLANLGLDGQKESRPWAAPPRRRINHTADPSMIHYKLLEKEKQDEYFRGCQERRCNRTR